MRERYKNKKNGKIECKRNWKINWKSLACLIVGILLYIGVEVMQQKTEGGGELERNSYGEGEIFYHLEVEGITEDTPVTVEVLLNEQIYTEQAVRAQFQEEYKRLCEDILGENVSLQEVRHPLELEKNKEHQGIRFSWKSSRPDVLSDEGNIMLSYRETEAQDVDVTVTMEDGRFEESFTIRVFVYPPTDGKEERLKEFQMYLQEEERKQQTERIFVLPSTFNGKSISYHMVKSKDSIAFLIMSIVSAIAFYFEIPIKERENQKKREHQMRLDYAEIVSKLLVFLGAGFSVRGAWEKVVIDYEKKREENRMEERFAYEEMRDTYAQITSGVYESHAYGSFGRRCGLHCYVKLGYLLEQNLKTGNKNLRELLEKEMESAFEEKRQTAKKLGEEVGTKLVIPMVLLLGVVMIMVVVPAFMAL